MRPLILAGFAVATAGLFGLVLEPMIFDGPQALIEVGSIKVTAKTDRYFAVSTIVGVLATVAGAAMVYLGRSLKPAGRAR